MRRPIPIPGRFARRALAATTVALLVLAAAAVVPALAKEAFDAQLDAPIARDTPAGTPLQIGVTVTYTDQMGSHPVDGAPVYVRLLARDRADDSRGLGTEDRPGHYVLRLVVPGAGVTGVEVGMADTPDVPFNLVGFTVVPGGITARTAQVAPPVATAVPPPAALATVAAAPAAAPAGRAAAQAPATGPRLPIVAAVAALAVVGLGLATAALLRTRARDRVDPRRAREV